MLKLIRARWIRLLCQPPSGGCVLKHHKPNAARRPARQPPSGGCVLKLPQPKLVGRDNLYQPPSGGCVLKLYSTDTQIDEKGQPPSGGCVLKQRLRVRADDAQNQPPSGGCVLKHDALMVVAALILPAAFRRLCVETPAVI